MPRIGLFARASKKWVNHHALCPEWSLLRQWGASFAEYASLWVQQLSDVPRMRRYAPSC